MTQVSTHVLDTSRGTPAAGIGVELFRATPDAGWLSLGADHTDSDGRAVGLAGAAGTEPGLHRLVFSVGPYQRGAGVEQVFLEEVAVNFQISGEQRLHVPLLLSPYGISVYRGS